METLISEDGATVLVIRGWIPNEEAAALCLRLAKILPWQERDHGEAKQPNTRRVFACGDDGVDYGFGVITEGDWVPELDAMRQRLEREGKSPINSCLVNEYRDGSSYISYHSDKEVGGPHNAVFTVSLGGSRDFYFKHQRQLGRTVVTTLNNGDCTVMMGRCQENWTHSIPKRAHADYRLSVTFRYLNQ